MAEQRRSREMTKAAFVDRLKGNQQKAEQGGGGFFRNDLKDTHFWKCSEGDHKIDIIPYFAGPNDPLVVKGEIKEGEEQYVLEFFIHGQEIGMNDKGIMCLMATYGRPCPVCEDYRRRLKAGEEEKKLKALRPKFNPRSVYNIIDIDNESKGVQVFHTSHYLMESELLELAKVPVRAGQKNIDPVVIFFSPDEGKSVAFKRVGTGVTTQFTGMKFFDRPQGFKIDPRDLEDAYCLDNLLLVPTYDEVVKWYGADESEERGRTRGHNQEDDVPDPETLSRGRGRGVSQAAETEQAAKEETAGLERGSRRGKGEVTQETSGRRERGQDKEVVTAEETKSTAIADETNQCPHGHIFAVDIDKFPDNCEVCTEYRACGRKWREVSAEKEVGPATAEVSTGRRSRGEAATEAGQPAESGPTEGRRKRRD